VARRTTMFICCGQTLDLYKLNQNIIFCEPEDQINLYCLDGKIVDPFDEGFEITINDHTFKVYEYCKFDGLYYDFNIMGRLERCIFEFMNQYQYIHFAAPKSYAICDGEEVEFTNFCDTILYVDSREINEIQTIHNGELVTIYANDQFMLNFCDIYLFLALMRIKSRQYQSKLNFVD
jgi:hypothetical protein